jgi:hypothetical protein
MSVTRPFCLTPGAFSTAITGALKSRLGHSHHLFGDAICFLLVGVSRSIDSEFRLEPDRRF